MLCAADMKRSMCAKYQLPVRDGVEDPCPM